jgi:drug/metabolite transporter (DMT)-like permease
MAIIGCYVVASIGMNLLNKEAATTFRSTFLLVIIQMAFASAVILLMEFRKMSCARYGDLLRWAAVPLAFAGMLATSMWAMREASLSAVLILKNFLPIVSFAAEKALFNTPLSITKSMVFSLFVTFVGTVLYGFADASVTNLGKLFVVVNCVFTLADRLIQTYYLKLSGDFTISVPLCMLLNNTLGIVPMLALAFASGEMPQWRAAIDQADSDTWLWVVLSSGCGACLGYVGLRTQQLVSGTTVLVLQNLNKILLLGMSAAFLGDSLRPLSWVGCAISIGGCCWYSALRLPAETKGASASLVETKGAGAQK